MSDTFTGWFRPTRRHPWQAVCEAEGFDACWALLIAHKTPGDGLGVEKVVLPAGSDPNQMKALHRVPRQQEGGLK